MLLNEIANFWFDYTKDLIPNHIITTNVAEYPEGLRAFKNELQGRSMLVKKLEMLEVECIVRGYLEGSGLKDYKKTGMICGIKLPEGMKQADKLPEPIFTPSTKASEGHDINISFEDCKSIIGVGMAEKLKAASLSLYKKASLYAEERGLILADTKFEFGLLDGELVIADENFTRFIKILDNE